MEKDKIKEKIKTILIPILEHENINMNDETKVEEIDGWSSLANVVIITEIEKTFNIKFKLRDLNKMHSIGSIVDLIIIKIQD